MCIAVSLGRQCRAESMLVVRAIVFNKDGLFIESLDTAKVTYILVEIAASEFEEFECPNEVTLGCSRAGGCIEGLVLHEWFNLWFCA